MTDREKQTEEQQEFEKECTLAQWRAERDLEQKMMENDPGYKAWLDLLEEQNDHYRY